MDFLGTSKDGSGDFSQTIIFWMGTLAGVINKLKKPDKSKLKRFYEDYRKNLISFEKITELLSNIINNALRIAFSDQSQAIDTMTLGEFIKLNYNKLKDCSIILRAKHRPFLEIYFGNPDNEMIEVQVIDKKLSRKKPTIETDLTFEQKFILGEELDPFLSMINPKEYGTFSFIPYIKYWEPILKDFSDFIFILTLSFLHRDYLMDQLDNFIYKTLNQFLDDLY